MDQRRSGLRSDDRRVKRSRDRREALQFLVETVADRNRARALVLLDGAGRIVAGMGGPNEVMGLAATARAVAERRASVEQIETAIRGGDVTARSLPTREGTLYLAAVSDRMSGFGTAVQAVRRILHETARS